MKSILGESCNILYILKIPSVVFYCNNERLQNDSMLKGKGLSLRLQSVRLY